VVQGFLHQSFREKGCFISVDIAIFEEATPCLGASFTLGILLQLETGYYYIRLICFMYLLYSTFYYPHIYTSIPNWFSSGGGMMQEHHSQASHGPAGQPVHSSAFKEERRQPSHILNLNEGHLIFVRLLEPKGRAYTQALDVDSL
jgi:hypothetical protein